MASKNETDDVRAIKAIIDRQFRSLEWSKGGDADWAKFTGDFNADATLYPAARPARSQTVGAFVEQMKGLAQTSLLSFKERVLGSEIHVFGSVAVALSACEITENEEKVSQGVEAMLLIKEEGIWKIVSQGWDMESDENPIPGYLIADSS